MGFFTIFIREGLSEADYARALRASSGYLSTRRRSHQSLLATAGFAHVDEIDQTREFLVTARGWHEGRQRFEEELLKAEGKAQFEERLVDSKRMVERIEAGLLRRALFVCR